MRAINTKKNGIFHSFSFPQKKKGVFFLFLFLFLLQAQMRNCQFNQLLHVVGIRCIHFDIVVKHQQILQKRLWNFTVNAGIFFVHLKEDKSEIKDRTAKSHTLVPTNKTGLLAESWLTSAYLKTKDCSKQLKYHAQRTRLTKSDSS